MSQNVILSNGSTIEVDDCRDCGELCEDSNIDSSAVVCQNCADENYFSCDDCGDSVHQDDAHSAPDGCEVYCESCHDSRFTNCDDCGSCTDREDMHRTNGGDDICESCYENNYFGCEGCNEVFHYDECNSGEDGCYCNDCAPASTDQGEDYDFEDNGGRVMLPSRTYGVELEFTKAESGENCFEVKGEHCGVEFVSPVMIGDSGLSEVTGLLEGGRFEVSDNCGVHVHVSLDGSTVASRKALQRQLLADQAKFAQLVPAWRVAKKWCAPIDVPAEDERAAEDSQGGERYYWANFRAYHKHGTLEFRLFPGETQTNQVYRWTRLVVLYVDTFLTTGRVDYDAILAAVDGGVPYSPTANGEFKLTGYPLPVKRARLITGKTYENVTFGVRDLREFVDCNFQDCEFPADCSTMIFTRCQFGDRGRSQHGCRIGYGATYNQCRHRLTQFLNSTYCESQELLAVG